MSELEYFKDFRMKILDLRIEDIRNPKIMREIVLTFNAIGDILTSLRMPHGIELDKQEPYGYTRFQKNKEISKSIKKITSK